MTTRWVAMSVAVCRLAVAASDPVFPLPSGADATAQRRAAVAALMAMDEAAMVRLVPAQSGIFFTDCPNCDGGAQDQADWSWAPTAPGRLTCKGCGESYPDNARYPETGVARVAAPGGEHVYPYYERPDGYRIYFRAHADFRARAYMASCCQAMAELYRLTGEEGYARRSALLLDRFAQVYPGYACKYDYPFQQKRFSPYHTARIDGVSGFRVSKWNWWAYMDISRELLRAYDALRSWDGLDRLGDGGVRQRVEKDLLGGMVAYVLAIPEDYTNMSPVVWVDLVRAGRVLGRPEWISESLQRADRFMREQFLYDGHWKETAPSYCQQTVGLMREWLASLEGYEPAGPAGAQQTAVLARVRSALTALEAAHRSTRLPDGRLIPVNDTWGGPGKTPEQTASMLLPGMGLATLSAGQGEAQVVAWLNNTAGRGHKQNDALSMGLFAYGRELWRDLGYTHTAWRAWTHTSMSHNTVVVDGLDSAVDTQHQGNRLRAFLAVHPRLGLVEAEHDAAYAQRCSRFRRTLVLVGAGAGDAYLVDLFQVHGGGRHDWLLHGPADEDSSLIVTGCELVPFGGTLMNDGVAFTLPKGESTGVGPAGGYGFLRSLQRGTASGVVRADLRLATAPEVGVTTWLACAAGTALFTGEGPRLRQAEHHDNLLPKFYAPMLCARREGEALQSRFVAVHAPVHGGAPVQGVSVSRLGEGTLVTVVLAGGGMDFVVIGDEGPVEGRLETPCGPLAVSGHWAVVRSRHGAAADMLVAEGGFAALGETRIEAPATLAGEVAGWGELSDPGCRGWLDLPATLPTVAPGNPLLLSLADGTVLPFTPVRAEARDGATRVFVRERPAFERVGEGLRLTAVPQREIRGSAIHWRLTGVGTRSAP